MFAAGRVKERTSIFQSKTGKPVRFEITEGTRASLLRWIEQPAMIGSAFLWPGRFHDRPHISTRQYARLLKDLVASIGLEPSAYGTHSMRRTKSRRSTRRRRTCARRSFCWGARRWTARSGISGSSWMTLSSCRRGSRSESGVGRKRPARSGRCGSFKDAVTRFDRASDRVEVHRPTGAAPFPLTIPAFPASRARLHSGKRLSIQLVNRATVRLRRRSGKVSSV